jgi:polyisoprenyl-phosphate glycosyltransferase
MSTERSCVLWVVCPVYRDVESLLTLRKGLGAAVAPIDFGAPTELRLVAIDDTGGLDPEIARLRDLDGVRVLAAPFNLGHQDAIVYALRSLASEVAPDDFVVTMDSDGEDQPEDLPRLLAPVLADPANLNRIALAQRTRRRESLPFKLLYFFFKLLFRLLTGTVIRTGNYAAYRGFLVHTALFHPNFDLVYSSSLISVNLDATFVPCERGRRYAGQSRMGYLKLLVHGVRMLMPFLDRITIRAIVAFALLLGLALAASAAAAAAHVAIAFEVRPWVAIALVATAALSLLAMANFVVLFAIFHHLRGASLRGLAARR